MTATRLGFSKAFTVFSFTFLQDTGWYNVDMRYPDFIQFGYHGGCDFLTYAGEKITKLRPKDLRNNL